LLLDRPQGPVLPEYTYNVIRKINIKNDLMCPIVGFVISKGGVNEAGCYAMSIDFIGVVEGCGG
jgi:hypothetical protein